MKKINTKSSGARDRKVIYGLNETGKSYWTEWFLQNKNYVAWSPNIDDPYKNRDLKAGPPYQIVIRPSDQFSLEQQNKFVKYVMGTKLFQNNDFWVVFEEAHNAWPNKIQELPPSLKMLITMGRHKPWKLHSLFIALRPAILNSTIQNLALSMTVFRVTGKNDVKALNNIQEGMGDAARELENYHFITWKTGEKGFKVNPPI
jgi:hypothetical protein